MFTSLGFEALNVVNQLAEKRAGTRRPAMSEPLLGFIIAVRAQERRQDKAKARTEAQTTNGDANGEEAWHVS